MTSKCKQCSKELANEKNIFCSRSCAASFNNKGVRRHGKEREFFNCVVCDKKLIKSKKFCSNECQGKLKRQETIESGDFCDRTAKAYLLETRGKKCEVCKLTSWMEKEIPLDLDHIDGNSENKNFDNLRLLCCNCHAQTPTYKVKNMRQR